MIIIICIVIIIFCDIAQDSARERNYYDKQAERRHQELLEAQREAEEDDEYDCDEDYPEIRSRNKKTRTIVREIIDEHGRVIRETITEEV